MGVKAAFTFEQADAILKKHKRANKPRLIRQFNELQDLSHAGPVSCGWFHNLKRTKLLNRNDGEMIALMHSELSEALEGVRRDAMDSHLPHRKAVEVELADTVIRIFDYARAKNLDLAGAYFEKLAYNLKRADHKAAARGKKGGKKF
jgi:NTP pyrophosphatase (non-canonical NTP hydrolase)